MQNFNSYDLGATLLGSVSRIGFETPTEIQAKTIPLILNHHDIIAQSKTGSGKTAAYMLPVLRNLELKPGLALVLVPTRELALQVEEFVKELIPRHAKFRMATVIGGASMGHQQRLLSHNPHLIIATPGRLVDHLGQNSVRLDGLKHLILDEADRMLDMGFYPQIRRILARVPRERQTLLFSATFDKEVKNLAREIMKDPIEIAATAADQAPVEITQSVIEVDQGKKNDRLLDELNKRQGSVLIFSRTKHRTDRLFRYLTEYGYEVARLHGGRTLGQRKQALAGFKCGEIRILVATDVASRGIDVDNVGHVINFDLPQSADDYMHRIGRTGRAGATGQAVSFVTPEDRGQWNLITRNKESKSSSPNSGQRMQAKPRREERGQKDQWKKHKPNFKGGGFKKSKFKKFSGRSNQSQAL
jgi:superfamily II DNA/RNA helicase